MVKKFRFPNISNKIEKQERFPSTEEYAPTQNHYRAGKGKLSKLFNTYLGTDREQIKKDGQHVLNMAKKCGLIIIYLSRA